jgi:spore coat protein H
MKPGLVLAFFIVLACMVFLIPQVQSNNKNMQVDIDNEVKDNVKEGIKWNNPLNSIKLVDNDKLYKEDDISDIEELYVTILPPSNNEYVTFHVLNNNINLTNNKYDYKSEIVIDYNRDINNSLTANATIEIRGQTARLSAQKSYKIKLYDNTDLWYGLKTINLNKHFYDDLRIRNKLSFDYFKNIQDFISLRTKFVKLYVRDLSENEGNNDYINYGLYTAVEQPSKSFLQTHNLDVNGHLYKAEFFEFMKYSSIKLKDDFTYDKVEFEKILEIIGSEDHDKLISMIEAVNDYSQDINKVVDKYFDRDNLLTWLGINILFNNRDSNSRNFLLYSPLNSEKWFFLPWDYDDAWKNTTTARWEGNISNYWGMILFNRLFKDIDNVNMLTSKIKELTKTINKNNTLKLLNNYHKVVKGNIYVLPDSEFIYKTSDDYDNEYFSLGDFTEKRLIEYNKSLENPMPIYLGEPIKKGEDHEFRWDASYDLQSDELTYDYILSKDLDFSDIVVSYEGLHTLHCHVDNLDKGKYYWKVIVRDSKGNWQEAFDNYIYNDEIYYGCKEYVVN